MADVLQSSNCYDVPPLDDFTHLQQSCELEVEEDVDDAGVDEQQLATHIEQHVAHAVEFEFVSDSGDESDEYELAWLPNDA